MAEKISRVGRTITGRLMGLLVQLIGILSVGLILVTGFLIWRLASGPISLAFLTPYFETALSSENGAYRTVLEDTILKWVGSERSVDLQLRGVLLLGPEGNQLAEIPELSVSLSGPALMQGRLALKSLSIVGPRISIVRKNNGTFGLDFSNEGQSGEVLVTKLLNEYFRLPDRETSLSELNQINIRNASVTLNDQQLDTVWQAPRANISLNRVRTGITGVADIDIKLAPTVAKLNLQGSFNTADMETSLTVGFSNIIPSTVSKISKEFAPLRHLALPVTGNISSRISVDGAIKSMKFDISAEKGTVNIIRPLELALSVKGGRLTGSFDNAQSLLEVERCEFNLGPQGHLVFIEPINHKLPVRSISIVAKYMTDIQQLEVEDISADLAGPTLNLKGVFQEIGEQVSFEVGGSVIGVEIDDLAVYWPRNLEPLTRKWVTENLSVGNISVTRAKLNGLWSKSMGIRLNALIGDMEFNNTTVNYFSPMLKATAANGSAKFDKKNLEFQLDEAQAGDLVIRKGRLLFTGLDEIDQFADIRLKIDGSLKSALELLDIKPLEFAQAVGINTDSVGGISSTEVKLNFIVERALTAEKIDVSANANLREVSIPNVALGKSLTQGNLVLNANNRALNILGEARLENVPVKLEWHENFDDDAEFRTKYGISGQLSAERLQKILSLYVRPFDSENLSGDLKFDVTARIKSNGQGTLQTEIDLKDARIFVPEIDWVKSKMTETKLSFTANYSEAGINKIPSVKFMGGGLTLTGSARFNDKNNYEFNLINFEFGETVVSGKILYDGAKWQIQLGGPKLDLTAILNQEEQNDRKYVRGPPIKIDLKVDQIKLSPGRYLSNIDASLRNDGLVWSDIKLNSDVSLKKNLKVNESPAGTKKTLEINLSPSNGKRHLHVTAYDAGAVLKTFDIYKNIDGGKLILEANFEDMSVDSKVAGTAKIHKFRLIDAPILARLLSIASITGILDELDGEGLKFEELEAPFTLESGIINLKNAKAGGWSLGITASGLLDKEAETLDIKGSVAPLDKINSILGRAIKKVPLFKDLPLIRDLFSGGEKGGSVFAAEYSMVGPINDPEITTNPLTALTPGIFRKIFKIFPDTSSDGRESDWKDPDDLN